MREKQILGTERKSPLLDGPITFRTRLVKTDTEKEKNPPDPRRRLLMFEGIRESLFVKG